MRSCVETRGLEALARRLQQASRLGRYALGILSQEPVDVVHAKTNPFHMEGADGARECLTFLDDPSRLRLAGARFSATIAASQSGEQAVMGAMLLDPELVAEIRRVEEATGRADLFSGFVSRLEANIPQGDKTVTWKGLNDLPYGVYTLELSQGEDEMKMRLIKRV